MISKILIIEDEKPNADRLKRLIKVLKPKTEILAVLDSIADSVEWLQTNESPDVIMMDVRLSDGLSFEIFDKIKVTPPVIFTTAYDEYAVKAFKQNSVDYLLKPIEQSDLAEAFEKLEYYTTMQNTQSLDGLLEYLKPKVYRNRFLLPFRDGYKTVLVSDVVYFYSELKITRAKLFEGNEEILPQTLEELEHDLDPKLFFRVNRQYILHIDCIARVNNYFNGKLKIEIRKHPEIEIVVSREKANQLKDWLDY